MHFRNIGGWAASRVWFSHRVAENAIHLRVFCVRRASYFGSLSRTVLVAAGAVAYGGDEDAVVAVEVLELGDEGADAGGVEEGDVVAEFSHETGLDGLDGAAG